MTVTMFNSVEDTQAGSDTSQQESVSSMMPEFYEMEENIGDVSQPMEVVQGEFTTVSNTEGGPAPVDTTASTVNGETLTFINDGSICATEAVSATDEENLKSIDIPETWNISVLESESAPPNGEASQDNEVPPNAESSNENDKLAYQLWECPNCSALFREKDQCEQHITKSHDFTCGLCSEPFHDKDAFEAHIIRHVSDVPNFKPKVCLQVYEYSEAEDIQNATPKASLNCSKCNWTFSSAVDLQKHEECHLEE